MTIVMTTETWLIAGAVGALPLAAVAWARWRFAARRLNARADKLNADARTRMEKLDDKALAGMFTALGASPAAKRITGLIREKRYVELQRAWGDLWPELVHEGFSLDRAIDLGAAINVLAARHPPKP
jgi:hypothetical protein